MENVDAGRWLEAVAIRNAYQDGIAQVDQEAAAFRGQQG